MNQRRKLKCHNCPASSQSRAHGRRRGQSGSAVLILLILMVIMLVLITVNQMSVRTLNRELNLLEHKQTHRLNQKETGQIETPPKLREVH